MQNNSEKDRPSPPSPREERFVKFQEFDFDSFENVFPNFTTKSNSPSFDAEKTEGVNKFLFCTANYFINNDF